MQIKKTVLLSWLTFCWLSCSAQIIPEKLFIDPGNAFGGSASSMFSAVRYIPLETKKESFFGEIDQLVVTPEYFIVLDYATDAILFFNKDGSYHHKLKKLRFDKNFSHAPGTMDRSIASFQVSRGKQELQVVSVYENNVVYLFNFEGQRIGKQVMPTETVGHFQLPDSTMIYWQRRPFDYDKLKGFIPYDISFGRHLDSLQYLLPFNFKHTALYGEMGVNLVPFSPGSREDRCFFIPEMDFNVYELDRKGIAKQYRLIFPMSLSLPADFINDSTYVGKRKAFIKDQDYITQIMCFNQVGNYLIFDLRSLTGKSGASYPLLYSLKTKRCFRLDHIAADTSSSYLPVNVDYPSYLLRILTTDADSYYSGFSSLRFFAEKESGPSHGVQYNDTITKYFKTQNWKSNPVIIQLTPKDNL